ncbi:MAG: helix-turn-helix transcriptional regulator [Planctomycetes bacterium]|nr:helix-turn-helix transcriptional regulator [Planctomycetota bacterium]
MPLDIGRAIRIVRQAKRLKANDLARKADVSVAFLSLVEGGDRQPSLTVLRRIALALGVPPEVLILLSQPTNGTLRNSSPNGHKLTQAIRKLVEAEETLRDRLLKDGAREAE